MGGNYGDCGGKGGGERGEEGGFDTFVAQVALGWLLGVGAVQHLEHHLCSKSMLSVYFELWVGF